MNINFFLLVFLFVCGLFFLSIKINSLKLAKSFVFPWVVFFGLCLFFGAHLFLDSILSVVIILTIVSLSLFFLLLGQYIGGSVYTAINSNISSTPISFSTTNSNFFYFLMILGFLSGVYVLSDRFFLLAESLSRLDFYSLRMSVSESNDFSRGSIINLLIKFFFCFCFMSLFFGLHDFKRKHFSKKIYIASLALLVLFSFSYGARLPIVYLVILVLMRAYFENVPISRYFKMFFILSVFISSAMFYWRVPVEADEAVSLYKSFFGFENFYVLFGFLEIDDFGFDSLSIVGLYFVHSISKLEDFLLADYVYNCTPGAYTFVLPMRIISHLFDLQTTLTDCAWDDSKGYYTTYIRDPFIDFGFLLGSLVIFFISFLTGFYYNFRNFGWAFRVVFYFGALAFVMAPLVSVLSGGHIALLYYFCLAFSLMKLFFSIHKIH